MADTIKVSKYTKNLIETRINSISYTLNIYKSAGKKDELEIERKALQSDLKNMKIKREEIKLLKDIKVEIERGIYTEDGYDGEIGQKLIERIDKQLRRQK